MSQPFSPEQINQFRQATPGIADHIHFNNAGASLPTQATLSAIKDYLTEEALVGGYKLEAVLAHELAEFYTLVGKLINCSPAEVAIVESATLAWRTVFNGLSFQSGDEILTSEPEYGSNIIAFLQAKKHYGVEVKVIPNDPEGQLCVDQLQGMINERTRLIAISHIPSNSGIVQPAEAVGEIAATHQIPYLLDACQSAGQFPLNVEDLNCDYLTATGRKYLRGPRGTGFLYVRKEKWDTIDPPLVDMLGATFSDPQHFSLRTDARRFETYEGSRALQWGLKNAIQEILDIGMDKIWARIQALSNYFRGQLEQIPGITVQDEGKVKGGIVTLFDEYYTSTQLQQLFEEAGIRVSVTPKDGAIHYMHGRNLPLLLRASLHYYNTEAEIDRFCEVLLNSRP